MECKRLQKICWLLHSGCSKFVPGVRGLKIPSSISFLGSLIMYYKVELQARGTSEIGWWKMETPFTVESMRRNIGGFEILIVG